MFQYSLAGWWVGITTDVVFMIKTSSNVLIYFVWGHKFAKATSKIHAIVVKMDGWDSKVLKRLRLIAWASIFLSVAVVLLKRAIILAFDFKYGKISTTRSIVRILFFELYEITDNYPFLYLVYFSVYHALALRRLGDQLSHKWPRHESDERHFVDHLLFDLQSVVNSFQYTDKYLSLSLLVVLPVLICLTIALPYLFTYPEKANYPLRYLIPVSVHRIINLLISIHASDAVENEVGLVFS